ncbi:MAG TPA: TolC family protein [Chitinophagaceae bacterium]
MKHPRRQSKWFALALAILTCSTIQAQEKHAMSVKQAVEYAEKNSVAVKNALIDIQLQQQTNKEITALALPNVSGAVDVNYFPRVPITSFPNFIAQGTYQVLTDEGVKNGQGQPVVAPGDFGFIQAAFGTKYNASAGVSLSQLLFDGQVFIGLQARKAAIDLANASADVVKAQVRTNLYKIYYQVVVGRDQIATIDANIDMTEKLLRDTREIFKNGFAEKLDVSKVEVTLANLRTERIRLDNQLQIGMLGLKMLMGMPEKDQLTLTDTLSENQLMDDNILEMSYNYADRQEFQQITLAKKLGEFNVRRYRLSKLPTVSLFGSYSKIAQRNQFNFLNFSEDWFTTALVGLKLSVPIFEGFAKDARIKKAQLELEQTANNMTQLQMNIDNEVEQARTYMRSALASMEYQRKNMQLAQEVYDQTRKKYEQGLGSQLEITTAQTELRVAQNNYYLSLYAAVVAKVDYYRATGKL